MNLKRTWQKLRNWIIQNYQEKSEAQVADLVWLKRTLKPGESLNWSFVDTVDCQLDSLPKRKELIMDFKVKPQEVSKKWLNLLNWKKES